MSDEVSAKRTRASGEVLDLLLMEFERNANPLPDLRKEISERTGMNEKAVRIWFQNRRAKLRKVERMSKLLNSSVSSKDVRRRSALGVPDVNRNSLTQSSLEIDSQIPITLNEKYCFLDCLSLLVGLWQRIKLGHHDESALTSNLVNLSPFTLNSTMTNVDLMVILLKRNQEINYFFLAISNYLKILFRIFYPVLSILTCSTVDNNIKREQSELCLSLLHRPKFLVYFFNGANLAANQWSICDDFSEGQQVSHACLSESGNQTPHVLVGAKKALQFLNAYIHESNLVRAQNPTPPDSATSTSSLLPAKYHAQAQIQFDDPSHHGNLQFVADEMNFWDEGRPETPATSVSVLNPPLVPLPNLDHIHHKMASITGTPLSATSSRPQHTPAHEVGLYNEEPDFFSSFDQHFEHHALHNQSAQPSTGHSSVSDHNSPSVNTVKSTQNVHSYTHTALHNNQYTLGLGGNHMQPSNTFDLLEDTFHASEFDFALVEPENASVVSNAGQPNVNTDHNTPIDNSGAPNSSACSGLSNVDSFIDFGSNYP